MEHHLSDIVVPKFDLTGKVALITGGTKGLGYATAVTFATYGANIVVAARTAEDCVRVQAELETLGVEALGVVADVTVQADIDNMVAKAVERFGHIDILVNNAGNASTAKIVALTEEMWDGVLDLDLKSVLFVGKAVAAQMIAQGTGGRIINIASAAGIMGSKGIAHYCAAKAGVVHMTKSMALEWAQYGVTVNAICPGYFPTSLNEDMLANPKVLAGIVGHTAVRRLARLDEVVAPILMLASDHSGYMTGSHILIDGGGAAQ